MAGVSSLSKGSTVRLGGMPLGRVHAVDLDEDDPSSTIRVEFELDSRVTLHRNAQIMVKGQLIGSEAWLEIPFVGDAEAGAPEGPDRVIVGTAAPGMLSTLLGTENAERAGDIVRNADMTLENAAEFSDFLRRCRRLRRARRPTLQNVEAASRTSVSSPTDISNDDWPRWAATWTG